MSYPNRPVYCPPKHVVHDSYVRRVVPVVHPVIHVNRRNIVNVPRHIEQPIFRNVVVDPGYPDKCPDCHHRRPHGWF